MTSKSKHILGYSLLTIAALPVVSLFAYLCYMYFTLICITLGIILSLLLISALTSIANTLISTPDDLPPPEPKFFCDVCEKQIFKNDTRCPNCNNKIY